jgi:hypothetical protein
MDSSPGAATHFEKRKARLTQGGLENILDTALHYRV